MITAICLFSNPSYGEQIAEALNGVSGLTQVVYSSVDRISEIDALPEGVDIQWVRQENIVKRGGDEVSNHLSRLYQECLTHATGSLILTQEQDVQPPAGGINMLVEQVKDHSYDAVSAVYDEGYGQGTANVRQLPGAKSPFLLEIPRKKFTVANCLIGCTVFDSDSLRKVMAGPIPQLHPNMFWEGWLGARFAEEELTWIADGRVRCLHKGK